MATTETITCEGDDCPDTAGTGTGTTEVTQQVFCPFRDELTIKSDGTAVIARSETQYADGSYNQITLTAGCVAGLDTVAARRYVPSICCDEDTTTTPGTDIAVAPDACNLSAITAGQLMTSVSFDATGDYTVQGCGTADSPFRINGPSIPDYTLVTAPCVVNDRITVTGAGSTADPLKVCHKEGTLAAGDYDGITIDSSGHITAIDLGTATGNTYISDDFLITPTSNTAEYNIAYKPVTTGQTVSFIGVDITYNDAGQITNITTPANPGISTVVNYVKTDTTAGTLTFTDGVLTGQT